MSNHARITERKMIILAFFVYGHFSKKMDIFWIFRHVHRKGRSFLILLRYHLFICDKPVTQESRFPRRPFLRSLSPQGYKKNFPARVKVQAEACPDDIFQPYRQYREQQRKGGSKRKMTNIYFYLHILTRIPDLRISDGDYIRPYHKEAKLEQDFARYC